MDSYQQLYVLQVQVDIILFFEQICESFQVLVVKLQLLIEGYCLDNLVDLLLLFLDIVDLLDLIMVDRLVQFFEQVISVGWLVGNVVCVVKVELF